MRNSFSDRIYTLEGYEGSSVAISKNRSLIALGRFVGGDLSENKKGLVGLYKKNS